MPYQQIEQAYRQSLEHLSFNGPTNVRPVIAEANRICSKEKAYKGHRKFMLLLLLTDGVVEDIRPTVKELALSVGLPLSVVFVGIGDKDFTDMQEVIKADK